MVTIHHQQIAGRKSFPLEPAHVTIPDGCAFTGDSRSKMYEAISKGEVEAVKEGNRTLLVFESLKKRVAARKPAVIGAGDPKFRPGAKRNDSVGCIKAGKAAPGLIRHGLPKVPATGERQRLFRLHQQETQTWSLQQMSAFGGKADIAPASQNVRL